MSAMTQLAPKLDPLIRRLASDRDGERLACLAAIQRRLDRAGLTWHDLADRLTSAPERASEAEAAPIFTDYTIACEWILATDCGELTSREIRFVEDMQKILRRWPPRPKQAAWLRLLVDKLGGHFDG